METESGWWRLLTRRPKDQTAWLVYADWLQDRGDDRAEGVRAIALLKLTPWNAGRKGRKAWGFTAVGRPYGVQLSSRWWDMLAVKDGYRLVREAVSDAARAFGKLEERERRYLLAGAGMV